MGGAVQSEGFVWPPRRGGVAPEAEVPLGAAERAGPSRHLHGARMLAALERRPAPWVVEVERVWLDTRGEPLGQRIAETGWCPDVSGAYCGRCGRTVGGEVVVSVGRVGCSACAGSRPGWHRLIRLGGYEEPLREWVHEVKFTRWRRLGMDLGRLLGAAVGDEMDRLGSSGLDAGMAGVLDRAPVVVPMPTTLGRLLVRGIDHAKAIARGVAAEVGGELAQPLRRLRRPSQTEVAPSERGANVSRAVVAKRKDACRGLDRRLVVLVDDVTTTGATLRTACRALREGGLSLDRSLVWVAIVGVAGERERGESSAGVSDRPRA